ncbi:MAG: exodeoxyribonuclease VII large subunit [Gemmatimonadota bacterium]|nr:exodeoxyribonuclease VII large subunit [Gemmatimonadota bacterium]
MTGAAPGATPESAIPVSALNAAARRVIEESFGPLWVTGEVTNWRPHSSGHRWFSLRDADAQLPAVMWRSDVARLPAEPEEGMAVQAFGAPTLYEARGQYQFVVRRLEAAGEGLWRLAFERLRRRLAEEGLLDPARRRPIPRVPRTVGVATSRSGAALRDVVAVIRRRAPWTRILVSDCRVQGEGAARDIVAALARLVRDGTSDVIVVTRGGGSTEDLWAFNDEMLAREIAASPVPVVSAVGHEVDVTISDLVADLRAPTPSAAAEAVTSEEGELRTVLREGAAGLVAGLRERTRRGEDRLQGLAGRLVAAWERAHAERRSRIELAGGRLHALSPLATLARGFAIALDPEGRTLRRTEEFPPGRGFRLRVSDGTIPAIAVDTGERT